MEQAISQTVSKESKGFSLRWNAVTAVLTLAVVLLAAAGVDAFAGGFYDLPDEAALAAAQVQVFERPQFRDNEPSDFGGSWELAMEYAEQPASVAYGYLPQPKGRTLAEILAEYQKEQTSSGYVQPVASFSAERIGSATLGSYQYYHSINSDVIGWLKVPGTNINYPVLHNGTSNNYYLERAYDKSASRLGCIWADYRVSSNSNNTVIYGHNWSNVSAYPGVGRGSDQMFAQLPAYHYLWFAQSYPYIHYSTPSGLKTWKVFAVMYTDIGFDYINVNASGSSLQYIIDEAKRRSLHNFSVDVSSSDRILTLSTCTRAFGRSDRQRFVVMAREMRPGESIEAVTVTSNPNYKRPSL